MPTDRNEFFQQPPLSIPGALVPSTGSEVATPLLLASDDSSDVQLPLSHYVWLVRTHWVKMTAFVAFAVIATAMVTARLTPQYSATATLYLDRSAAKNLVGQDSQSGTANKGDSDAYIESQKLIITSDAVLRPVVEKFRLQANARDASEAARVRTARLNAAPVKLKGLTVVRPQGTYALTVTYRSADPVLSSEVANAVANSYVARTFDLRFKTSASLTDFMQKQLKELTDKTTASEEKVAILEKELQVINPDQKTSIASALLQQLTTQAASVALDRVKAETVYNALKSEGSGRGTGIAHGYANRG